jgi:hypothetical protein
MVSIQESSVPNGSIKAHFAGTPIVEHHSDLLMCKTCLTYASGVELHGLPKSRRTKKNVSSCSLLLCGSGCGGIWCVCKLCRTRYRKSSASGHLNSSIHQIMMGQQAPVSKPRAVAVSAVAEAAKEGDPNVKHQRHDIHTAEAESSNEHQRHDTAEMKIDSLDTSAQEPPTNKRKLKSGTNGANLKPAATAISYDKEQKTPGDYSRRLVACAVMRISPSFFRTTDLPTPAETMYHLKTTVFLLSLSGPQIEKYANLMLTSVGGLLTKDDSQKIFQRTSVLTSVSDIKETYLKGPHSIMENLTRPIVCMPNHGDRAIAFMGHYIKTVEEEERATECNRKQEEESERKQGHQRKRKQDVVNTEASCNPDVGGANLKRAATAPFYEDGQKSPGDGSRRLVARACMRVTPAKLSTTELPTPAETMYHLKTTEFLLSLSDSQMEEYADWMLTSVSGLLDSHVRRLLKDAGKKIFQRTRVYTSVLEIRTTYLKGKYSIVGNLPCMTEKGNHAAIAYMKHLIKTVEEVTEWNRKQREELWRKQQQQREEQQREMKQAVVNTEASRDRANLKRAATAASCEKKQQSPGDGSRRLVARAVTRVTPTDISRSATGGRLPSAITLRSGTGESSTAPQTPLVNSMDEKSEDENEAVIAQPGAVCPLGQAVSASDEREKKISEWLMNLIGFDPDLKQMELYARKFVELGLHSVEMINALCTADDVAEFSWMLKFHKRQFLSRANLKED